MTRSGMLLTALLVATVSQATANTRALLLVPDQSAEPSAVQCDALVMKVQPSLGKANAWLSGRAPFGSELEFYLLISDGRMETTFAAEGDYDTGDVTFGRGIEGRMPFEIRPDDHPGMAISGEMETRPDSRVVVVVLHDVPSGDGRADRVSYYCSFEEELRT